MKPALFTSRVSRQCHYIFRRSISEAAKHQWQVAAGAIHWDKAPTIVIDRSKTPFDRWFPDGVMNTCFNALDRHVLNGDGASTAIIYDSPVTNTVRRITFNELLNDVTRFAGLLRSLGVQRGDRVIIYMPMIPEAVVAMLSCARLGAMHSVVFGGFAAPELAVRMRDTGAKVVLTASCGIDSGRIIDYKSLVDAAVHLVPAGQITSCVVLQRPQRPAVLNHPWDIDWATSVNNQRIAPVSTCEPMKSTDPLYVLYTSGTTAAPKGVVRDNGGHAVALKWSMRNIFNMRPGDVFWAAR